MPIEFMKGHFCIAGGHTRAKRYSKAGRPAHGQADGGEKRLSLVVPNIKESRLPGSIESNNRPGPTGTSLQTQSPLYYSQGTYGTSQPQNNYAASYISSGFTPAPISSAYAAQAARSGFSTQTAYASPTSSYSAYSQYSQPGSAASYYDEYNYNSRTDTDVSSYYYNSSLGAAYSGYARDTVQQPAATAVDSTNGSSLYPSLGRVKTNPIIGGYPASNSYPGTAQLGGPEVVKEKQRQKYGITFESMDELFLPATGNSGQASPADNRSPSPTREWRPADTESYSSQRLTGGGLSESVGYGYNQSSLNSDNSTRPVQPAGQSGHSFYNNNQNQVSSSSWRGEDQLKSVMTPQGLTYKRRREEQEKEALLESDFLLNEEDEKLRPTQLDNQADLDNRTTPESRDDSNPKQDNNKDVDTSPFPASVSSGRYSNPQSVGWAAKRNVPKAGENFPPVEKTSVTVMHSEVHDDSPPGTPREKPQMVLPPPQAAPKICILTKQTSARYFFKKAPPVCSFDLMQAALCEKNAVKVDFIPNVNVHPICISPGSWPLRDLPNTKEFERLQILASTTDEKIYTRDYQIPDAPGKLSSILASQTKGPAAKQIKVSDVKENRDPRIVCISFQGDQALTDSTNKQISGPKKKSNLKSKSTLDKDLENKDLPPEIDYRSTNERDDDLIAIVHLLRILGVGPNEPLNYTSHLRKLISENLRVENIPESVAAKQNVEFLIELLGVNRRKPGLNESRTKPPRRAILCKHYASSSGCHNTNCLYRHDQGGFGSK